MKSISILAVICALSCPVMAVQTSHWTSSNEADFKKGRFQNTVATNLGDVKLSRAVKTLLEQDPRIAMVCSLAEGRDGTIYAGTGPHGIILQIKGEKISTLATLDDQIIYCLLIDRAGSLLAGTGGERGRVLRIGAAGEKPQPLFEQDSVQYVWAMQQTADGNLYVATGANGQVFEIKPDGSRSILFDCEDNNILSLISDGKDLLYAGTDPNGLVYRINRKTGEAFVIFDAPEAEVSALALDAKGNLYVGTAQAGEGDEPSAEEPGATEKTGRPEGGESGLPLPSQEPKDPKPPAPPVPDPSQPRPIPKGPSLSLLDTAWEKAVLSAESREAVGAAPAPVPPPSPNPPTINPPAAGRARVMPPGGTRTIPPGGGVSGGNAIYRIDRSGFVSEIFREPVMVMSIIEKDGVLLVGTGSEGLVYEVNPAAEEMVVVAKVDPKQVMSMLLSADGRVILGLANVGGIAAMSRGYAEQGTYSSAILDAMQISRFGKIHLQGALPEGTSITVATRSGNLAEPRAAGWSKWSEEVPATEYMQASCPSARYFQYRLTFASKDGRATPVVDEVDVAYLQPNLAPQVKTIRVSAAGEEARGPMPPGAAPAPKPTAASGRVRQIAWEATDPNNDAMDYALYYRSSPRGQWILIQDRLKEPQYRWDTRTVAEGRYQIKAVASDARSNPRGEGKSGSRMSEPVVVDNTPPVIGDLKVTAFARGVKIEADIIDRTSIVASAEYSVDSKDDWQALSASDSVFDSPEEAISLGLENLSAGQHQITLRASDSYGNQAYQTVTVTIRDSAGK